MTREVKFRGMKFDDEEWLYGNLIGKNVIVGEIVDWDSDYFATEFWWKVDPKTVGQYTGLNDKNGKEVFEGDIVTWHGESDTFVIEWVELDAAFAAADKSTGKTHYDYIMTSLGDAEVIGNIYENPELLEVST